MAKKILTGLFVCMFVFAFSFVSIAVSEEYSGTAKLKGKAIGLDEGKGKLKEKCAICIDVDDEDGDIHGTMVCDEGGEDETTFNLGGMAGDQAFFVWAYAEEEDDWVELVVAGKLKGKMKGDVEKLSLKGTFVGICGDNEDDEGILQGKIKAKLVSGADCELEGPM